MKWLLQLVLLFVLAGCEPMERGPRIAMCPFGQGPGACTEIALGNVSLAGEGATLVRGIAVRADSLPLPRPLMVRVIAMASSEVSWNGVIIGRNGEPGPDAAHEVPGRFVASFVVPQGLVRPGVNLLSVRMSAHHLFLPVRTPVHLLEVGPYESPLLPGLGDYLPALLTLGALATAFLYFSRAAWGGSGDRNARLLAPIALVTMLQLAIEVSRAFLAYSYPWHLVRVTAIALLSGVLAILIANYSAFRFAPGYRRPLVLVTSSLALASILLVPWFDIKAMGAILAGALAVAFSGWTGMRARLPYARLALLAAAILAGLMAWQFTMFLDRAWYHFISALLVLLIVEQVADLRRARAERDREARQSAALARRLARAEREGEPIVAIKDGNRVHRVAESDIVSLQAADDYADLLLRDGRRLMTTLGLARMLESLPACFVRVHKSHVVNRSHVITIIPTPGGGRCLLMSDGSRVPVGRTYVRGIADWAAS